MTVPSSPSVADADRAAADWFVAHDVGLTDDMRARFKEWHDSSQLNREAWLHAQMLMSAYAPEDEARLPGLADVRNEALSLRPAARMGRPAFGLAAAACLTLVIGTGSWRQVIQLTGLWQRPAEIAVSPSRITARSSSIAVSLADGSRVQLDAHTDLDVRMLRTRRDLRLVDGRAFFQVEHDASRPFVVSVQGRTITATGTAFAVTVHDDDVLVVLQTGHVRIASGASGPPPIDLEAGQEYRFKDGQTDVRSARIGPELAWRQGFLDLRDVSVSEALADLNRLSTVKVNVADEAAGRHQVTGRFPYADAPGFAAAVASIYPVHVVLHRDGSRSLASNTP